MQPRRNGAPELDPDDQGARIPLRAVYEVFEERADPARPVTANDVMDAVGCSRRTAHDKLTELVERGVLRTRKVGSRGRVWWVPLDDDSGSNGGSVPGGAIQAAGLPGTGTMLDARREALAGLPGVDAPDERGHVWQFLGEE